MKINIAIVWGGYTSESIVSERSMLGIYSFLDKNKFNVYKVKIDQNEWSVEFLQTRYIIDKNDFSFTADGGKVKFDFAYITIHGTPGEDGRLQGYFDMIGVKYSSCGVMASALTMNKYICNQFLQNFGINIAPSHLLRKDTSYDLHEIADKLKFPIFVKPNLGGSSFATTKVKDFSGLQPAIKEAFDEASEVIIEQFIAGREITCGCYKTQYNSVLLPITEVITKNEFFDYNAKYEGEVEEITPAELGEDISTLVKDITLRIYNIIGAKGIIRADYIISDGVPFLLEVNTTPGMTETSFIPQQIKAADLNITEVLSEIVEYEYYKHD